MELNDNDIVVSGISGRFPSSNNVQEFAENLYNKVDMTDEDESRWRHFRDDVPKRFGKIRNLEKFDASFFSTLNKHANWTDPQMRILLEHAYEVMCQKWMQEISVAIVSIFKKFPIQLRDLNAVFLSNTFSHYYASKNSDANFRQ